MDEPPSATGSSLPRAVSAASAYCELHCRSAFSFLRGAGSIEALVERAAAVGISALALTDYMTLAGTVRFQAVCTQYGIKAILGAELAVADPIFGDAPMPGTLVVLAQNRAGYARLCQLLTDANLAHPATPRILFSALAQHPDGLLILTGGREGHLARLVLAGRRQEATVLAQRYRQTFGAGRVWVELQHHALPESIGLLRQLHEIAEETGLRVIATNGVCFPTCADLPLFDLLTCTRLGITIDEPHIERPRNDEAYLKSGAELDALFADLPYGGAALAASSAIAAQCDVSLLRGVCSAPQVPLPPGMIPARQLRQLCETGLRTRYAQAPRALAPDSPHRHQLVHELDVIARLELAEFFLCVHDIVAAARQMGIRVSGRGSAANSLVAYLLGITGVDPLQHRLLFERFLNPDRSGMPDIDLDVQSDRRDELIRYVERTYSEQHAAMVANVITYRPRSALRDAAKALGYPLPLVNQLTKVLHHHGGAEQVEGKREELAQVIARLGETGAEGALRARCLERLPHLLEWAPRLVGLPRHLSLHNGGLVLTRESLTSLLPVRLSANGVRALEIDKDDVERLGLIKFDLLGLRTLGAIEEALALIEETTGKREDIDHLPLDDAATFRLVRAGQTLAVFQIESPGQWHLLAQTQPTCFTDLIVQTALFRPGPIVGGFVRPYVAKRLAQQGQQVRQADHRQRELSTTQRDAVQTPWQSTPADPFWTDHAVLGPILAESEGILLFQEQILEIAHRFAGLSYAEADGFRRAMSHQRSVQEMEAMRGQFVAGAIARGEREEDALRVFGAISAFVGYGFCKSHAAEFARTIYQTAYLKAHFPAHYLAAFLSCQPAGFFPPHVVLEEAKACGVPVLGVDINRSADRFSVERVGTPPGRWAIRIGLAQVAQVGEELARAILWERRGAASDETYSELPFMSLQDFCLRLCRAGLSWSAAEALVMVGAFDGLAPHLERRQRLWQLHELWPLVSTTRKRARRASRRQKSEAGSEAGTVVERMEQLPFTWELPRTEESALPMLPALSAAERSALDYRLLGMSARVHPMHTLRRQLRRSGIRPIAEVRAAPAGSQVQVAGWAISAQRPSTAHGMGFVVLEDESGRLPVAFPPKLAAQLYEVIRNARVIAVVGRVEQVRWYRSVLAYGLRRVT